MYSLGELEVLLRAGKLDVREALPIWEREVTGFIERFPKLSPFLFYPALLFLMYAVVFTVYRGLL